MQDKPWIEVIHNIDELKQKYWNEVIWVLWWAKTFETLMPYIDELYITLVPGTHDWDSYMPKINLEREESLWKTDSWLEFKKYTRTTD